MVTDDYMCGVEIYFKGKPPMPYETKTHQPHRCIGYGRVVVKRDEGVKGSKVVERRAEPTRSGTWLPRMGDSSPLDDLD